MFNLRFALLGLTGEEAYAISDALSQVCATADRLSADAARAGLNALASYDACIVDASAITPDGFVGAIPSAEIERRRVLVIANETQLPESDLASAYPHWEFIVRPLRSPELLVRLSRLMCRAEEKTSVRHTDDTIHRVLVVDDDQTVRALLSAVLEAAGFKCDCVPTASEALAALAGGHHDLVLLDIGMPDIDGFRVLKALRRNDPARSPAVIIVSSATDEDDLLRGFGLGADDYVTKPFNPRELVARCQHAIRARDLASLGMRDPAVRTQSIAAGN